MPGTVCVNVIQELTLNVTHFIRTVARYSYVCICILRLIYKHTCTKQHNHIVLYMYQLLASVEIVCIYTLLEFNSTYMAFSVNYCFVNKRHRLSQLNIRRRRVSPQKTLSAHKSTIDTPYLFSIECFLNTFKLLFLLRTCEPAL